MDKPKRKNKTKQLVTWPSSPYFTFNELLEANPHFTKKITLYVRLTNARDNGNLLEIASQPGNAGRPPKVFAITPLTTLTLDKAEKAGLTLVENIRSKVGRTPVSAKSLTTSVATKIAASV
jgi:hypothetical protein